MIVANGQRVITNLTSKKIYLAGEAVPDHIVTPVKDKKEKDNKRF